MSRRHVWKLSLAPIVIVCIWIAGLAIGGPYFGKIDQVSSNDLSTFLPKSAESTTVKTEFEKFQTGNTIPAIVVFESPAELTDTQKQQVQESAAAMQRTGVVVGQVSRPITSEDKRSQFIVVPVDSNSKFKVVIDTLQTAVRQVNPSISYAFTGPAMFSRDINHAFAGIDGTLLLVALAVVFVILLIVYKSPILPIVTLMGAMAALSVAIFVVWHFASAGILQLNGQVQGILFILVIGAATDYALLYIARYREELLHQKTPWQATRAAWKASWEPIVAAGGTVALGLLCLLASDLGSNKALGPVGSIGIGFAVLSALTFLPAVLLLVGRRAFWPRMPRHIAGKKQTDYHADHPVWTKVGMFVSKYPRRVWAGTLLLLIVACCFAPQLKATGVSQSELIIGKSEARDGQAMLNRHFPSGSGSPVIVLAPEADAEIVAKRIGSDKGVDMVSITTNNPRLPLVWMGPTYAPSQIPPKVIDGKVALQVTLRDVASSVAARETVQRLRSDIQPEYPAVMFGGVSAIQLDTNNASEHDLKVIIPLILIAITCVLMLLLRSIVAPLVLLVTTVLSFGATLGVSALMFNNVWKFSGADPSVIIYGFVFLVALGIDYNIFLMTRIREETAKIGVRAGTIKGLIVTGGVITSAGVVLASTFAALYVIPILFLAQIAFVVSFGVLLDAIVVRSLLVPALTLEIGRLMWWPSSSWQKNK